MLILSRKVGEEVVIGDSMRLIVVSISPKEICIELNSDSSTHHIELAYGTAELLIFPWKMRLCLEQEVVIDDNIRIKVTDVRSNKVRLGFDAPRHIKIDRKENHG